LIGTKDSLSVIIIRYCKACLQNHLTADGRLPDEYFLYSANHNWGDGALFLRDAHILCSVNYGGNESIYFDVSMRCTKKVYEYHGKSAASGYVDKSVVEHFATGKTLGENIGGVG